MKRWKLVLAALLLLLCTAAVPPEGEPRNVRLSAEVQGDTVHLELRWVAPQRSSRQTPIEGYNWQWWLGSPDTGTMIGSGAGGPGQRSTRIDVLYDCSQGMATYSARVRAEGDFASPAPWGVSGPLTLDCDNSPPGAPMVELDTLASAPAEPAPDSTVFRPVRTGAVEITGPMSYLFTALGDTLTLTAVQFRGGAGAKAPPGWVVTAGTDQTVLSITARDTAAATVWDLVSLKQGFEVVALCDPDCYIGLARASLIPGLPINIKRGWPPWLVRIGLLIGFFLLLAPTRVLRRLRLTRS